MKDQVENLRRRDIRAAAVYSGQTETEIARIHSTMRCSVLTSFSISRLNVWQSQLFMNKVQRMKVCLITVDEAHCISQSGLRTFRPHYLRIAEIRQISARCSGAWRLTATATTEVVNDIQEKLGFGQRMYSA